MGRGSVDKGVTQEEVGGPERYKVPGTCEAWKMGWDCGKRCFIQGTVAGLALESVDPSSNLAMELQAS